MIDGRLPELATDRIANPRSGFGLHEFESHTFRAVVSSYGRRGYVAPCIPVAAIGRWIQRDAYRQRLVLLTNARGTTTIGGMTDG